MSVRQTIPIIAHAIRDADTSWFNENYTRQAAAVVAALRHSGYEIVPRTPPEAMIEAVADAMPYGRMRRDEMLRELYQVMVEKGSQSPTRSEADAAQRAKTRHDEQDDGANPGR